MGVKSAVGKQLAPRIAGLAPGLTTAFVREALNRAIEGVGPLPPAARAADKQLREQHGDVERAVHEVIENHVRLAGAQGFVTNIGGLVTATILTLVLLPILYDRFAFSRRRLAPAPRVPAKVEG